MESPLWIDTRAPGLDELPQADLRAYLSKAVDNPINLVLHGPAGSGKTAAVKAMTRETHEDPENDLVTINVADFFNLTKSELMDDPRFSHFLAGRSDMAKGAMMNHVLKETASYSPVAGSYKTILLDNAEAIREDFQHALRRVMERYHAATQFVITTRQPTKLIPPITSRCFPVPVREPTDDEIQSVLRSIATAEAAEFDDTGLQLVARHADGNLRAAILAAQTVAETEGEITAETVEVLRDVGPDDRIETMIRKAEAGDFTDARSILDDLLVDEGFTGYEVLAAMTRVARSRDLVGSATFAALAGEIDFDLATGTNDRLHLGHLLADLGAE